MAGGGGGGAGVGGRGGGGGGNDGNKINRPPCVVCLLKRSGGSRPHICLIIARFLSAAEKKKPFPPSSAARFLR